MRMDKVNRLVNFGIGEIEKIAPDNAQIEVDVKEGPVGHFKAMLVVKANRKVFFAKKEGDSIYESFHKAMRALKSQLSKEKKFHRVHQAIKYQDA